jgi:hypothetical protein
MVSHPAWYPALHGIPRSALTLQSTLTLPPAAGKLWERKSAALVLKGTYAAKLKELGVSMGIEPHHLQAAAQFAAFMIADEDYVAIGKARAA